MHQTRRIPIVELNDYLTCRLCKGYFVDATTIIECLHTFCRSCIVRYLEKNKYCPVCDVQVHKTKPLLNIRPDKTLQDIVYKLVPRLFQDEMCRRRDFYASHLEYPKPTSAEQCGEASYEHILSPDEMICVSLNYHGSGTPPPRYLQCSAAVSIAHLQKLLRSKYDLTDVHRVDILHNQDCLNSRLALMDIAYMYLWKRKAPLELTYRIYENMSRKLKQQKQEEEQEESASALATEIAANMSSDNNKMDFVSCSPENSGDTTAAKAVKSEWKEVQLRISENGEMSITGVDDTCEILANCTTATTTTADVINTKSLIAKSATSVEKFAETKADNVVTPPPTKMLEKKDDDGEKCEKSTMETSVSKNEEVNTKVLVEKTSSIKSTERNTRTKKEKGKTESVENLSFSSTVKIHAHVDVVIEGKSATSEAAVTSNKSLLPSIGVDAETMEKVQANGKHKLKSTDPKEEPCAKQLKPTVLNSTLGLLSNDHPLKRHSQIRKSVESDLVSLSSASKGPISSPAVTSRPLHKWQKAPSLPCYVPKTNYNPVINVPKVQATTSRILVTTTTPPTATTHCTIINSISTTTMTIMPVNTTATYNSSHHTAANVNATTTSNSVCSSIILNNRLIKSKSNTPIGYKTLRDPPKTWNPQVSRASLLKSQQPNAAGLTDLKNVKPAKFFKMRNNMPRYLGNPASGVKPLYQVHAGDSPPKRNSDGSGEIKKHSIVKIDPKTLKPVSEKAPDTSNLTNQVDLKISATSVPIFNPLKLQSSSPKNNCEQRKSPKSPHSPPKSSSPHNNHHSKLHQQQQQRLNYTPPNPFIPNLTNQTLSPNQFLASYAPGPTPGFPPYDPRLVAAYHSLLYTQGLAAAFSSPATHNFGGLDLNGPTSMQQQKRALQQATASATTSSSSLLPPKASLTPATQANNNKISNAPSSNSSNGSIIHNNKAPPTKRFKDGASSKNSEKSLQNTVEKLTQNRFKELSKLEESKQQLQHQQQANDKKVAAISSSSTLPLLLVKNNSKGELSVDNKKKGVEIAATVTETKLSSKAATDEKLECNSPIVNNRKDDERLTNNNGTNNNNDDELHKTVATKGKHEDDDSAKLITVSSAATAATTTATASAK